MKLNEAIELLPHDKITEKQTWADLGCGSGLFTKALAHILAPESIIYAVDTNLSSLQEIPGEYNKQVIKKLNADFVKDNLVIDKLDGILMANSLHFVSDKTALIKKLAGNMKQKHCFLVVEYDSDRSNRWVPYPLSFRSLERLFSETGNYSTLKLNERPSIYSNGQIYSAIVKKK